MKTKVTAILAVFVITLSMMATLSFATELTPTPVVAVADETLLLEFMEEYYVDQCGLTEVPIEKITATVCIWIWKECPEPTCVETSKCVETHECACETPCEEECIKLVTMKFLVTLEMVSCDGGCGECATCEPDCVDGCDTCATSNECRIPVITVEKVECDDTCGEPIDVIINTVTPDEALVQSKVDRLISRFVEQKTLDGDCILGIKAEICIRVEFADCLIPPMIAKWIVDAVIVEGELEVTVVKLDWHELIMNQLTLRGIIGFCRDNEIELVYDGPGVYESGLADVHFYLVYKVNDDPYIRDLQAHIELIRVGADTYVMEIYHSINNGMFSFELPYENVVTVETPYFTEAVITGDLC
jgi:hypothetical protein